MNYWLIKSEPSVYSIDDLARDKKTPWTGIRNYQARNFMRDEMKLGELAFVYYSSCDEPGIAGIAKIASRAKPDETQFELKSEYHDPAATREAPRWFNVELAFVRKTPFISLAELRKHKALAAMRLLQRGNRLSITPVEPAEWRYVERLMARCAQK
jgi:predicted RNA-binding protein with PUA-like domain